MKKRMWNNVRSFLLGLVFVFGVLRIYVPAEAASVVKNTSNYTLYSDGKLVIHNLRNIQEESWDDNIQKYAPSLCRELFECTEIGGEIFFVNANVTEIVLEENREWISNFLLEYFPNTQSITVLNPGYYFSLSMSSHGVRSDEDHYDKVKGIVDDWNKRYRNKMTMENLSNDSGFCYEYSVDFSKNVCIISYDVGKIKKETLEKDCSFQTLTCKLDKLSSIVANDSIFYDGKSHALDIESEMHIRCENDHGTESYLSHKVLEKDEQYTVSYFNKGSGKNGDTSSAGTVQVTVKGINGHIGTLTGYYTIKPQALKKENVILSETSYTYSGKAKKPAVTVKNSAGQELKKNTDYTVSYSSNVNAGTATVTIKGKGNYTGTIKKTFKIAKAKQTISVKTEKKSYTKNALTKKSVTFSISASAKTKLSYKSSNKKFVTVTSKGKVTVKKGTPKGTYKITVTAAAGKNYKSAVKTVKVTVK